MLLCGLFVKFFPINISSYMVYDLFDVGRQVFQLDVILKNVIKNLFLIFDHLFDVM